MVTVPAEDLQAMQRRIGELENALRVERRRSELLEDTARGAYRAAAWGGARRPSTPQRGSE
jgi:hypothetical protein